MIQNLAETERLSSIKSFELYRQILLKVLRKVGLTFVHFFMDESEQNEADG